MDFKDKFSYLMDLTNLKNKQIAEAINVDPSVISRLRSGKRKVPKNAEYTKVMAEYFCEHCTADLQKNAIKEVTGCYNIDFSNNEKTASIIESWLLNDNSIIQSKANELILSFDRTALPIIEESPKDLKGYMEIPKKNGQLFVYYGDEGKRQANQLFNEIILSKNKECNINVLTEGNTGWLWRDHEYAAQISENIRKSVISGCKINHIVPRNQSLPMAFDTVKRWLPLYMTGRVRSYYFPFLRDNVMNRTLYVAHGIAGLSSISVGDNSENNLTFLTTNPNIIMCWNKEFKAYLDLCKSATNVYNYEHSPAMFRQCVKSFYEQQANCISIHGGLSYITTPSELLYSFAQCYQEHDVENLINDYESSYSNIERLLEKYHYTEIIALDSLEDIISGNVRFLSLSGLKNKPLFYTPDSYILHLENIIYMLEKYPNFQVIFTEQKEIDSSVYIKNEYGILAFVNTESLSVCKIEYAEMVMAIWEYANLKTKINLPNELNKKMGITRIKDLICTISNYQKFDYC